MITKKILSAILCAGILIPQFSIAQSFDVIDVTMEQKVDEIIKESEIGTFQRDSTGINIVDIDSINGGVQVKVQAWANSGEQYGFGELGIVDIERINIINPPVLVPDVNGDIIKENIDEKGKRTEYRYRYDPKVALEQVIVDTVKVIGKLGTEIDEGRVGNTTTTFYPDPHTETSSFDGMIRNYSGTSFNAARDGTAPTNFYSDDDQLGGVSGIEKDASPSYIIRRAFFLFDTSSLNTGTIIDSAVLSAYGLSKSDGINDAASYVSVVNVATTSNTSINTADWAKIRDTAGALPFTSGVNFQKQSNDIDITSVTTSGYNDFTFNADGLSHITDSGVSKFSITTGHDIAQSFTASNLISQVEWKMAETSGTTQDPKLVVTHHDIMCGDGLIEGAEACDDGDTDPSDGCSATCTIEMGYSCVGEPSVCTLSSSSSSSSSTSSSSSSYSPPSFTGSLILTHTFCNDYILNGSGDAVGCNQWDTSIETAAIMALRVEAGAIVFGAIYMILRYFTFGYLAYLLARWLFRTITQWKPLHRIMSVFRRR